MTKKTLYITEKGSQVKNLDAALKDQGFTSYRITPLSGHITELIYPEEYSGGPKGKWYEMVQDKNFPFLPANPKRRVKKGERMKELFSQVKDLATKCDEIVLASDADNEGVLLVLSVLEIIKMSHKVRGMINMTKMDLESLKKEVHIENKIPYQKMNEAGKARSLIDWFFIQITVQATISLQKLVQDESNHVVHVGGVKTPTIKMVVDRDREFEEFKSIPFWQVKGKLKKDNQIFEVIFEKGNETRFFDKDKAASVLDSIKEANVLKVVNEEKKIAPPLPHSLTSLQSIANKRHGMKAKEVLEHAQTLYDNKYSSYPRTDSNFFAEEDYYNAKDILKNIVTISAAYKKAVESFKSPLLNRGEVFNNKKLEDFSHTAISITSERPKGFKSENEKRIYVLILHRYLMQFMDDHHVATRKLTGSTNIKDVCFKSNSKKDLDLGWSALDDSLIDKEITKKTHNIPDLKKGDSLEIVEIFLTQGESKPRPRYTDSTLLEAMENIWRVLEKPEGMDENSFKELKKTKMSLGTVATRASILEELVKGGYFKYEKKNLVSTPKARKIIDHLPGRLISPILRASLEKQLHMVVQGKIGHKEVISSSFVMVEEAIAEIKEIEKVKLAHIPLVPRKGVEYKKIAGAECPKCKGKILITNKIFRCENTGTFDGKLKKWNGECNFMVFKKRRDVGSVTQKSLKELLKNGKVEIKEWIVYLNENGVISSKKK